jgi:hypothetical protein
MWYATVMSEVTSGTNKAKLVNNSSANAAFGTPNITPVVNLTASAMEKMHVDIYPNTATTMSLGVVTGSGECKLPVTLIPGQWNSIDLSISALQANNPAANLSQVKQIGFWLVNGNFYMDNLLFYKGNYESISAVANIKEDISIDLFPNPTQDILHVQSVEMMKLVTVRNLMGQVVRNIELNDNEISVDLSHISSGNYFVTIKTDDGRLATKKIVKL